MKNISFFSTVLIAVIISGCSNEKNKNVDLYKAQKVEISTSEINSSLYADNTTSLFSKDSKEYHNGLKTFESNGFFGYIDSYGNVTIPAKFKSAEEFYDGNGGYAVASLDGKKYGIIDKNGDFVLEPYYDFIICMDKYIFRVSIDDNTGVVDAKKKCSIIKPGQYDDVGYFSNNGYIRVEKNGKYGFVDYNGNEVIKTHYDEIDDEIIWDTNGFIAVQESGNWGLIDIHDNIVIPIEHKQTSGTLRDKPAIVFPYEGVYDKNIIYFEVHNDRTAIARTLNTWTKKN